MSTHVHAINAAYVVSISLRDMGGRGRGRRGSRRRGEEEGEGGLA